jgi:hypothetical protein
VLEHLHICTFGVIDIGVVCWSSAASFLGYLFIFWDADLLTKPLASTKDYPDAVMYSLLLFSEKVGHWSAGGSP